MIDADTIIVGGGPAGSTCAWRLRESGRQVIVLDKQDFPRPKPCAGWITPRVVRDLRIDATNPPFTLTRFNRLHFHFRRRSLTLPTLQYAIRRIEFDEWLLRRAGVPVHRVSVRDIKEEAGLYVLNEEYRCRNLVGAGGTHCPVYRTFFKSLSPRSPDSEITAVETEFPAEVNERGCHLWFPKNLSGYSWYVPKADGYINVGVGGKTVALEREEQPIRHHWQVILDTLARLAYLTTAPQEPKGHLYYLRHGNGPVQHDRVYLIGDAASLATKDLGEGIGPAVRSGILAAEAIIRDREYSILTIPRYSVPKLLFPRTRRA